MCTMKERENVEVNCYGEENSIYVCCKYVCNAILKVEWNIVYEIKYVYISLWLYSTDIQVMELCVLLLQKGVANLHLAT